MNLRQLQDLLLVNANKLKSAIKIVKEVNADLFKIEDKFKNELVAVGDFTANLIHTECFMTAVTEAIDKLVGQNEEVKEHQKPLRIWIKNILNNSNEPLTVKEIAELVLEAGYKTNSKQLQNFRNIVQQTILNDGEFRRKTKPKLRPARYTVEESQ